MMSTMAERLVRRAAEVDERALALLRVGLSLAVILELVDRWPLLDVFYSDAGTYPVSALIEADGTLSRWACAYAWSGEPIFVRALATVHLLLALMLMLGFKTRIIAPFLWYLYFSLTARNCSIAYIADRYLHIFLLFLLFIPCERRWSVDACWTSAANTVRPAGSDAAATPTSVATVATMIARLQLIWIYFDAGFGKVVDPGGAWSLTAAIPALESMMRYTPVARFLRATLGVSGMRLLSASVALAECAVPSLALIAAATGAARIQLSCVLVMCGMHVGIALCMNNAALLSFTACVAWAVFLPPFSAAAPPPKAAANAESAKADPGMPSGAAHLAASAEPKASAVFSPSLLLCFVLATAGYHLMPSRLGTCSAAGDGERLWSALLNNRWNAFTSIEDHVTWYIAPAKLADGAVVDIWAHGAPVSWEVPSAAARSGRWKSFAAVGAGSTATNEAPEALWLFLCKEWNDRHPHERRVVRYRYFLLSANVTLTPPDTADAAGQNAEAAGTDREHGPPSKRLLQAYTCPG